VSGGGWRGYGLGVRQKLDIAPLLAAAGGFLLFISLFLHWYQPALTAWTVFEVWDLVLAVLGVAAVWVAVASVVSEAPVNERVLSLVGAGAFVIVVSQIVNHPPAAQGASPEIGAWLGLAGSALMAAGAVLSYSGVSLSVTFSGTPRRRRVRPDDEAAEVEPEVQEELYPESERRGPIGADDPEPWTAGPDDETLTFEPDTEERS
jgi:hypothetical protein